jgi:hypothetical protein
MAYLANYRNELLGIQGGLLFYLDLAESSLQLADLSLRRGRLEQARSNLLDARKHIGESPHIQWRGDRRAAWYQAASSFNKIASNYEQQGISVPKIFLN